MQGYAFLAIALAFGIDLRWEGLLTVLPVLVSGLMLGAIGLLLSTMIRQRRTSSVMNFVIFPIFFLGALYACSRWVITAWRFGATGHAVFTA